MSVARIIQAILDAEFNLDNITILLTSIKSSGFSWRMQYNEDSEAPELLNLAENIINQSGKVFYLKGEFSHKISIEKILHDGKYYILFGLWNYSTQTEKPYHFMIYDAGYENNIKFIMSLIPPFKIKKIYYKEYNFMIADNSVDIASSPIIILKTEFSVGEDIIDEEVSLISENIKKLKGEVYSYDKKTLYQGEELKKFLSNAMKKEINFLIKAENVFSEVIISYYGADFTIKPIDPNKLKQYVNKTDIDSEFYINLALNLNDGFGVREDFIIDGF